MKNLTGQKVLLTGASGGLGVHMTRTLARAGCNLALVAFPGAPLETLRDEARRTGVQAISMVADLRDAGQRRAVVAEAAEKLGSIDILINNAGVEFTAPYHELSEEQIGDMLSVNLEAAMLMTRLVLPGMLARGKGHIVCISSLAGKAGPAFEEAYAATKAGLVAFTASLRASYRRDGVSASVIVPGFVEAGIYARLKERSGCSAPNLLGTSRPETVAGALMRAIQEDRPEIIVNPVPVRPILALASLFPALGERVIGLFGTNDFFSRVVQSMKANGSAPVPPKRPDF